ncbi:MAG: crossover junction endodeoxyribonuclease RuvC [Proteobacteria bacterium]|nr:crossover junction endodeoxyribonuclease RuvC [Pseudomonadota bacterium]
MRLIGFDPGLQRTGWGVIEAVGNRLRHIADGAVVTTPTLELSQRLVQLHAGLMAVIAEFEPDEAAVEETFVNKNAVSTLKLGQARGIVLLVPALAGIPVAEYLPNLVKKTVVGAGHAQKQQVQMMIRTLLPGARIASADAADALAVAICHAHHRGTRERIARLTRAAE